MNNNLVATFTEEDKKQLGIMGLEIDISHKAALGTIPCDGPRDETPIGMERELMEHQKMLVARMREMEENQNEVKQDNKGFIKFKDCKAGVLMENVGTGKSDTILARILHRPDLSRKKIIFRSSNNGGIETQFSVSWSEEKMYGNLNWLVVPHSIMHQWREYIKNTELNYWFLSSKADLKNIKNELTKELWLISSTRYKELVSEYNHLIFSERITSSSTNSSTNMRNKLRLSRLIFDECDSINIPNTPHVEAVFYWFVSSSAQNIIYPTGRNLSAGISSRGFIRNSLQNMTDNIGDYIVKAPYDIVDKALNLPDPYNEVLDVEETAVRATFNGVVNQSVQSMLNANDYKAIAQYYNLKSVNDEKALISAVLDKTRTELIDTRAQETQTLATKKKIQKLVEKIETIEARVKSQESCGICFAVKDKEEEDDDLIEQITITPCCHAIWCFECIIQVLKSEKPCPKCRFPIKGQDLITVVNDSNKEIIEEPNKTRKFKNKEEALISILKQFKRDTSTPHRVLCFAEYEGGLGLIESICKGQNINAKNIKGTNATIAKRIKEWETEKGTSFLLLNAKRFGAGLNLQAGTDIILWHKLSSKVDGRNDLEKQVLGRVLRLGLDHRPKVWRLAYPGEYGDKYNKKSSNIMLNNNTISSSSSVDDEDSEDDFQDDFSDYE